MPVLKSGKKWRIGHGKPQYKSKASAERAYKGYLGHKYVEGMTMKATQLIKIIEDLELPAFDDNDSQTDPADVAEDAGMGPQDQSVEGWFGEEMKKHEAVMASIKEAGDPDLIKAKEEVKKVQDQLSHLKVTIHKEKEAGKSQNLLDNLKKQWQSLYQKIIQIWHAYDSKHGTKYAAAYER